MLATNVSAYLWQRICDSLNTERKAEADQIHPRKRAMDLFAWEASNTDLNLEKTHLSSFMTSQSQPQTSPSFSNSSCVLAARLGNIEQATGVQAKVWQKGRAETAHGAGCRQGIFCV